MATNNAINLKTSGIARYDGAGVFTAESTPLTIENGGTETASHTAYAVLLGNTVGSVQSVGGLGSSGNVLISNGPSSPPTFQATPTIPKFVIQILTQPSNPSDGTTYKMCNFVNTTSITTSSNGRMYMPVSGTINYVKGYFTLTSASAESITMRIRLNNTTNYDITTSMQFNTSPVSYETNSLGVPISAGDFIELLMVCPTWAGTNPLVVQSTHVIEVS